MAPANSDVSFLYTDGARLEWPHTLQYGRSGLVLEYPNSVFKIPRISGSPGLLQSTIQSQLAYEDIENEKKVYNHLQGCLGIVQCLQITPRGIELARMKQGSLEQYIENHEEPLSIQTRLQLSLSAVKGLRAIHKRWVLVFDVHPRNLLLTDDLREIRYCDFADSVILPFDSNPSTIIREGVTMQMDIFRLGSVLYAIMAWITKIPDLDFPTNEQSDSYTGQDNDRSLLARWPKSLPDVTNLPFLGQQIIKCWTQNEYYSLDQIYEELRSVVNDEIETWYTPY